MAIFADVQYCSYADISDGSKKVQKQFCKAKNGNTDAENYNEWCKMRKHGA